MIDSTPIQLNICTGTTICVVLLQYFMSTVSHHPQNIMNKKFYSLLIQYKRIPIISYWRIYFTDINFSIQCFLVSSMESQSLFGLLLFSMILASYLHIYIYKYIKVMMRI